MDEAISIRLARLDWRTLLHTLWVAGDFNMLLYHGLLHEWIRLGDNEVSVRTLSVLIALGSIGALYIVGKLMFGTRVALLGALLLVLNTYHIRYAQEARSYSLVMLLATLASLAFLQALARPTSGRWIVYTLTSVLAVYAQFFAAFVLVAHWLSAGLLGRRHAAQKGLAVSVVLIGLLLSPIALFLATARVDNVGWGIPKTTVKAVYHFSCALTGGGPWGGCAGWGSHLLIALYAGACALALVAGIAEIRRAPGASRGWRYVFLLMWVFIPIGLALGVSNLKPIFLSRYLIVCLPPLVLLASAGITRLRAPAAATIVVMFVAAAGYQDVRYYAGINNYDWRGATAYVLARRQPKDAVVLSPWYLQQPYDYYRARSSARGGPPVVSGWETSDTAGDPTAEFLNTLRADYSRVWILYHSDAKDPTPLNPRTLASFSAGSWTREDRDFGGVGVTLYTAR